MLNCVDIDWVEYDAPKSLPDKIHNSARAEMKSFQQNDVIQAEHLNPKSTQYLINTRQIVELK
ncbi:hypothetical protein D3C75_749250 [compost metagenome]